MATNFSHTWLPLSQSPCSDLNSKLLWWERCVKRKYNDGSGQLLQGYNMAHTEGGSGNFSCDAMWCTIPSIAHLCKTSITSRTKPKISSLQDKHYDRGYNLPLASTDHALQPLHIQPDKKDVSKKRIHMATSVDALCGGVQACDLATEDGVLRLKEALKVQKSALRKLYRDLEEERCASATAANEVMAMISRLQEEKAAALVKSRQYKRSSEEREVYSQEVITLLKDALSIKEHEYYYLQNHIEDYRNALIEMKSGQRLNRMIENNHLEANKENSQLQSLEGKETNYFEGELDEDCDTGDRAPGESMYWHHNPLEESISEGQMGLASPQRKNHILDTAIKEQDFEDVNTSILVRIARLEEQYACLGQNEASDPESFDLALHNMPEEANFFGFDTTAPAPMHKVELNSLHKVELKSLNSAERNNGFVATNYEDLEDLNCEDEVDNGATSIYSRHLTPHDGWAGCDSSMNEKLAAGISSAGIEAVKSSLATKDLQNLKVRLQTLEGERAFMKDAIEALRKENMELKLLQEIAHQLQELKGSGYRDQLPFLSFLKRTLSFAGLKSLACTEKRRFCNGRRSSLQTSSNKLEHGGLRHLLNNSLREEKSVCVTRERKVKLAKL